MATLAELDRDRTQQKDIYKQYPLRTDHYWYIVCMGINIPFYTIQYFSTLFLFARTSAGCDYKHYISLLSIIKILSDAVIIPVCAWITDYFSKSNHITLVICIVARFLIFIITLILVAIYPDSDVSIWSLAVSNLVFNAFGVQLNYSIIKVVKFQIECEHKHEKSIQIAFLTRIGIYAKFWFNMLVFVISLILYLLIQHAHQTASVTLALVNISVIVLGLIMLISSIFIYKMQSTLHVIQQQSGDDTELGVKLLSINDAGDDANGQSTHDDFYNAKTKCCFQQCNIFRHHIIRYGILHLIVVYILTDLLISYEPFHVAGVHVSDDKEFDNFCGSILINLFYQNVFGGLLYGLGAIMYIVLLIPFVDNWRFYRYAYPLIAVIGTVAIFAISGVVDFNQTVLALSISLLFSIFDYAHLYDDYLVLAYIPSSAVGFYQFLYLITKNGWQICGFLFLYLGTSNYLVIALIVVLLLISLVISFMFSRFFDPKAQKE